MKSSETNTIVETAEGQMSFRCPDCGCRKLKACGSAQYSFCSNVDYVDQDGYSETSYDWQDFGNYDVDAYLCGQCEREFASVEPADLADEGALAAVEP